jgi:hypothetical protein
LALPAFAEELFAAGLAERLVDALEARLVAVPADLDVVAGFLSVAVPRVAAARLAAGRLVANASAMVFLLVETGFFSWALWTWLRRPQGARA